MASPTVVRGPDLQETFIELYMNGLYTGLFFVTLYAMVFKRKMHQQNLAIFLALIALYIFSTIHMICRWILTRNAFIDNGDTAETISQYLIAPPLWLTVLGAVVFTLNTLVADSVLIWRCWAIWNRNWFIVAIPIGCTIAGAGLGFKSIQEQAAFVLNPTMDRNKFVDYATPYFSLSLITTCIATILIIFRISTVADETTWKSRGYARVMEIVVESALIYSVAMAIFLPLLVRKSANDVFVQPVVGQVTGIAPTLIVARVTLGFARPTETWQTSAIVLNTRPSRGTATQATSDITLTRMASAPQAYEK